MQEPAIYSLAWEQELLGIALSEHPIHQLMSLLVRKYGAITSSDLPATQPGQEVVVCGIVKEIKHHRTAKNLAMLFVTVEDSTGEISVTVFPKTLSYTASVFLLNALVKVKGVASHHTEMKRKKEEKKAEPDEEGVEEEEESSMKLKFEVLANGAEMIAL
jgi:DNA polymerase III alpha subunit